MNNLDNITLSPNGYLIFPNPNADWRERLFFMAAKREPSFGPISRYWRHLAESFIAALCRLPEDHNPLMLTPPAEAELQAFQFSAPPMIGGEYLNPESLLNIWAGLAVYVTETLNNLTLAEYLTRHAPLWRRVGRVTFHLAENSKNQKKPFAFMATYVMSLTLEGRDRHIRLSHALTRYSEAKDKPALLSLLTPVKAAAEKLPWVETMEKTGTLFSAMAWSISQAHRFLKDIPILEESGLSVRVPDWWSKKPQARVKVVVGKHRTANMGLASLLDWDVQLAVGDENLSSEEIQELLEAGEGELVFFKGKWLEVDRKRLTEALNCWNMAKESSRGSGLTFIQAMRLLAGLPAGEGLGAPQGLPDPGPWVQAEAGEMLQKILEQLRSPGASEPPSELTATLRHYQLEGLSWLSIITGLGLGGCLADDMGLGKTIQVLALLLLDRKRLERILSLNNPAPFARRPSLLVAPASLLANWHYEAKRFSPSLRLKIFHPSETSRDTLAKFEKEPELMTQDTDLVVTSYNLVARKLDFFEKLNWRFVILDEAQAVKNPGTAQSRAVRKLKADSRLTLTGTPIENRLDDLWSLFDFLNPGLLGSHKKFTEILTELESRSDDQFGPLRRLISPYLLRRLKTDRKVIDDLPDKVETRLYCQLTEAQAKIYATLVEGLAKDLKGFSHSSQDQKKRRGLVLQSLIRFKQLINHPAQLTGDGIWDEERSGKFLRLADLGRELADRQERLLVFTQYREIIVPLAEHLGKIFGKPGLILHGNTPVKQRQSLVEEFQRPDGPPFFILSLKAGGTGLNLTAAGQVIHFDRWWNPAVEDQATDRAYRIGQKKNVLVHKCVTRGTLEEKIDVLLEDKRKLAGEILRGEMESSLLNLSDSELLDLVSLDLEKAILR
ncbi:MAG: DEAD/DEAH box helicase [Deltaproteobacteria bacterium]|jgi:non-specific serine/threonine protein kinase|nr:DEAD/DEAH box helicase [Deltaproteobacteria bacterium]